MPGIDSFCKLMLHGDGDDGSQTIVDSETTPKTVTAVGNAQIDTAQKEFGTGSILFDGTSDNINITASADFNYGTGDFTIDWWMNCASGQPDNTIIYNQGDAGLRIQLIGDKLGIYDSTDAGFSHTTLGTTDVCDGTWHHCVITRISGVFKSAADGNIEGSLTGHEADSIGNSTEKIYIGSYNDGTSLEYAGWIDEFRISKGVARWTGNFTPPTQAYDSLQQYTLDLMDSMTSSDSRSKSIGFNPQYLDTITLLDLINKVKGNVKVFGDEVSLNDFLQRVSSLSQNFTDVITLQDLFNKVFGSNKVFLDTLSLTDSVDFGGGRGRTYFDDLTLSDAILILKNLNKLYEDSITLSDEVKKSKGGTKILEDNITLLDIFEKVSKLSLNLHEVINLNEKEFSIIYTDRDIIEISANPQIQPGTQGQFLSLQYVTDYPKLRWVDGRGLKLFKGKDFTMNSGSIINFIYDSANQVWNETSRMQDIGVLQGEG